MAGLAKVRSRRNMGCSLLAPGVRQKPNDVFSLLSLSRSLSLSFCEKEAQQTTIHYFPLRQFLVDYGAWDPTPLLFKFTLFERDTIMPARPFWALGLLLFTERVRMVFSHSKDGFGFKLNWLLTTRFRPTSCAE